MISWYIFKEQEYSVWLENKTLECCLTHFSEAHVTENKSSTLHLKKDNQICSSSNPVLSHDRSSSSAGDMLPQASGHQGHSEGHHMLHSEVIWELQILVQYKASLPPRRQPGRRARLDSNSSVRDEQPWIHSAESFTSNTSILFHRLQTFIQPWKHAIVMSARSLEFDLWERVEEQKEFPKEGFC